MSLRWGIVTAAKICHDFVNALSTYPEVGDQVITAVAARDPKKAQEFANTHGIPKVFPSYQAMAESEDIDVAYIGSLNPDHYTLTKLFLENGKHVLCEKPLCLNQKQVQSLVTLSREKKLFLMEAVWSRFLPSYVALEKYINDGILGEPQFVEVNFGVPIAEIARLSKRELGGGVLLDLGIYVLQFAQFIFKDEPTKVTATGELNADGVDLADTIILEYTRGRRAVLNVHGRIKLNNQATVVGNKGSLTLGDPFHCSLDLTHDDGKVEKFPIHTSNLPYNFTNSALLVHEAIEVNRCIQQGLLESPRMTHKESLLLAKLEDIIRQQVGVHYDADDKEYP